MNSLKEAFGLVFAMGAVILFCRALPFLFFSGNSKKKLSNTSSPGSLLTFVEKIVPPAAMTVLAFNALGGAFRENISDGFLVFTAALCTALIHLWKRNSLVSIFGGTILYMILIRIIG